MSQKKIPAALGRRGFHYPPPPTQLGGGVPKLKRSLVRVRKTLMLIELYVALDVFINLSTGLHVFLAYI